MEQNRYPIKYASRASGLKSHLIRSWEARYGAIRPERSDCNRRLFSDADISRLVMLRRAVERGHTISSIAELSSDELVELLENKPDGHIIQAQSHLNEAHEKAVFPDDGSNKKLVSKAMDYIRQLQPGALDKLITNEAVRLPRHQFLQKLILPIFTEIGEMWAQGKLKVIHEHMASVTIRSILQEMLRSTVVSENAPMIAVATPVGHWHELGALTSALAATESGWRAFYFGPDLPSEEIVYGVQTLNAKALALSVCYRGDQFKLAMEITKIRKLIGNQFPIFIGGRGVVSIAGVIEDAGIRVIDDLRKYRDQIEALL
jgi:DNA-binding transcriptional MerR regulator